jgi:predicted transglutaminase-like cysteine proteinase
LVRFCANQADLCGLEAGRPSLAKSANAADAAADEVSTLTLTPALWRTLSIVNADVNWAITPGRDEDIYGAREVWALPISQPIARARQRGDCEDYVLEKRARLLAEGLAPAAMQIAVAVLPELGRHTVLIVRTDRGDLVLDNRIGDIVGVGDTPYQWVSRQEGPSLLNWVALEARARPSPALMAQRASEPNHFSAGARMGARAEPSLSASAPTEAGLPRLALLSAGESFGFGD